MSIAALNQVYDEMRRLAIAGGNLASGDFRLKKLVEPLKASAAKAPVFGKVAEAVEKVVDAPAKESAAALLELSTLVTAILYTQGETGATGKLAPIPTTDFGMPSSNTSARTLKPLLEALTTTGSGREEIIKDAHQRGAFKDLRLVRVTLNAIDDVYPPIADFVADQILPTYGKAIYEEVLADFDPKSKGGAVRRLKLLHRIDREKTREYVQTALDSGSADMKVAAIECLEGSEEALPFLLEQAKAKSADVCRAALGAMATLSDDKVVDALIEAYSKVVEINPKTQTVSISLESAASRIQVIANAASRNRNPKLLTYLLKEAESHYNQLFSSMKKNAASAAAGFHAFLQCFATRNDKRTIDFLTTCFQRRDDIAEVKGDVDGVQINRRLASLLIQSKAKPAWKLLVDSHKTLPSDLLGASWTAAILSCGPKEVYDIFSPYYLDTSEVKKKKKSNSATKRDAVAQALRSYADNRYAYRYYIDRTSLFWMEGELEIKGSLETLDPRWLDAAIKTNDLEMVLLLARPGHKGTHAYLSEESGKYLQRKDGDDHTNGEIYATMIRIEHPKLVDHFLMALNQPATQKGNEQYVYWLARLIPGLPKSAASQIEKLLPTLGDTAIDRIAPYLSELQAKP